MSQSPDYKLMRLEQALAASRDQYQRLRISREIDAHKAQKTREAANAKR